MANGVIKRPLADRSAQEWGFGRSTVVVPYVVLALVLAASLLAFRGIDYRDPYFSNMDFVKYRVMAAAAPNVSASVPSPFAYRIAGPWLAGMLPLSDALAFRLLNGGAAVLLLLGLYSWMRASGVSAKVAALMTGVLAFSKATLGFLLWDYFQLNDTITLALLCWTVVALMRRRWLLAWALLLVSVLFRESLLIMIPAVVWLAWESRETRRTKLICAAGVCLMVVEYLVLHHAIPTLGGAPLSTAVRAYAFKYLRPGNLFRLVFNTYVPLSLVPLLFWRQSLAWLDSHRWLGVLCVSTLLASLGGGDVERLLAPVFLVVLVMSAGILELESRWPGRVVAATLLAAVLASPSRTVTSLSVPSSVSVALSVACTCAVAAMWVLSKRRPAAQADLRSAP